MIELTTDQLVFRFPEVHEDAVLRIEFQRTLRIPDDDKTYPLPPGLGRFPVRHVDDFAPKVPAPWMEHGGVMLPMYQSEALWVRFQSDYPFAVRVCAGKIDAVTGEQMRPGLGRKPQNYVVAPAQHWIDGFCVSKGVIRQFVAMPLGEGYTAEEQITGSAEYGGLQIVVHPIKAEVWERIKAERMDVTGDFMVGGVAFAMPSAMAPRMMGVAEMGLAPGGRMKQHIYEDEYKLEDWHTDHTSRCFVHLANSIVWRQITGQNPPTTPPTAKEYTRAGLPWFDLYSEKASLGGSGILNKLKSVMQLGTEKGASPLPENESVAVGTVVKLRDGLGKNQVREGDF